MKIIKAIIIDDEKHARKSLSNLLEQFCPQVSVVGNAENITKGLMLISAQKPQVVFLDIAIGSESGFDLLHQIEKIDFQIIFTTGFSEFAIKAFKVNALDYLLKPIDPEDLQHAVKKYEDVILPSTQIAGLLETIQTGKSKQLAISTLEGVSFFAIDGIVRIEGSGNYATFTTMEEGTITASKSLKHFESLLPSNQFYRSHQSHLVNLHLIKKILVQDGNSLEMKNGDNVPLVRNRKEELLRLMKQLA